MPRSDTEDEVRNPSGWHVAYAANIRSDILREAVASNYLVTLTVILLPSLPDVPAARFREDGRLILRRE